MLAKGCGDGASFVNEFRLIFQEGKDARFDRSHAGVEVEDDTGFFRAFVIGDFLFVVGLAKEGQGCPIDTRARLDYVGEKLFSGFFIKIFERLPAGFLMLF